METDVLDRLNRGIKEGRIDDEVGKVTEMIIVRLDQLQETQADLADEVKHMRKLMERLIVLEERQNSHHKALERFGSRLDGFEKSLHEVEKCVDSRAFAYKWVERALMVVTGAMLVKFISVLGV